ncbi:MAG: cell wall-binding repeat-containing protein, partial [Actinobacteria bacterium]
LTQIKTANPTAKVTVVGGPGSVPAAQITQLTSVFGAGNVERLLSTGSRYDMAAAVSARMRAARGADMRDAVFFANGADSSTFFDALALSAASRSRGIPILLVAKDTVPPATTAEVAALSSQAGSHGVSLIRILGGGPGTVSEAVRVQLGVVPGGRWYGADRYSTSTTIARNCINNFFSSAGYVAVAAMMPDALSGGASIGRREGVLVVTAPTSLPSATGTFLHDTRASMGECYIFGGTGSVSTGVESAMKTKLAP